MNQSIYIGYSSSRSNATAMDIVGDNVANINTVGFKGSYAEFGTLFSGLLNTTANNPAVSSTGQGMRVNASAMDLSQGSFASTESVFNMAINGQGWFGVVNDNIYNARDISFTRDGTFGQNSQGFLVNGSGNYLLGSDYGRIVSDGQGGFQINTSADPIPPSTVVGAQSTLFAPKNLSYPHTTTSSAVLQKNLLSEGKNQIAAYPDSGFEGMLTYNGSAMALQNNQDFLLAVGTSDADYVDGKVAYRFVTQDDSASGVNSAAFTLNGTAINVTWNEGESAAVIAAAFNDAINTSGASGVTAIAVDSEITLLGDEAISITGSDYAPLGSLYIADVRYDAAGSGAANRFTSLQNLSDTLADAVGSVYGDDSAEIFVNAMGQIEVAAKSGNIVLDFQAAANTNTALLASLNALNGITAENTLATSQTFTVASTTSAQKIINDAGEAQLLYVTMTQITPTNADTGSVWQADAKIVSQESATELTDAAELISNGETVGLRAGQDLWVSLGNGDVRKTTLGYDYALSAPEDIADGQGGTLSFVVNGTTVSVAIADGSSPTQSAGLIFNALEALGIPASLNGEEVLLHANSDAESLTISNGSSTYENYTIPSHALARAVYGGENASGFTTLEEFVAIVEGATQASGLALTTAISDAQLSVENLNDIDIGFRVLSGANSNAALVNLLNPTYDPITAGSTVTSLLLNTHTVVDSSSRTLTFDTMAQLPDDATITLQNGTQELVVDLSGMTNYGEAVYDEFFTQNGYAEGNFGYYDIDQEGRIIANFDNGKNVTVAQVNLYHFQNEQGLERIGGNQFMQNANSGDPFFYTDSEGNLINGGIIQSKMIENSNVSTASALTEMIVLQRAFDGAARIITTSDELLKNAINMKK